MSNVNGFTIRKCYPAKLTLNSYNNIVIIHDYDMPSSALIFSAIFESILIKTLQLGRKSTYR